MKILVNYLKKCIVNISKVYVSETYIFYVLKYMASVGNLLNPLLKEGRQHFEKKNKIVFLTYTNELLDIPSKKTFNEIKSLDFFDKCIIENDNIVKDKEFIEALKNDSFRNTFNIQKGSGMWLWKPYIIYKQLSNLNNGDYLVYCDPGGSISKNPILKCWSKNKIKQYLNLINTNNYGTISFQNGFPEYKTTKYEVFEYFNIQNNINFYIKEGRISNLHFIKKCDYTIDLYSTWWNIAKTCPLLFDDCICRSIIVNGFVETRNEQSIWSLLCKKKCVPICYDNPSRRPIRVSTRPIYEGPIDHNNLILET
jgi:hypothetical protein